jgi:hypothetical protein
MEPLDADAGNGGVRDGITRRTLIARAAATVSTTLACRAIGAAPARAAAWPPATQYGAQVPAAWFELALEFVRSTPGFSPPVASRAFGYAGVALHEAIVPGLPGGTSFAGRLRGLTIVDRPADRAYHWPTVANSALASILRALFPTASAPNTDAIDALERRYSIAASALLPHGVHGRSVRRGLDVALRIFEWSKSDGGHEGFLHNFPAYVPPSGRGLWEPTPPGYLRALQPYWGSNRPFVLASGEACSPGPPVPYSEAPGSSFHTECTECYFATTHLTPEQETVARFWSDDPGETPTPPGHWVSILTQIVRAIDLPLDRAADAYARLGIAIADAFIACWNVKYRYNLLRPVTYIRRTIDPDWTPVAGHAPVP